MTLQEATIRLLLRRPFFGTVAASVSPLASDQVSQLAFRMAPGPTLLYNRSWFEALSDDQAQGAVVHELLHFVLLHGYRGQGNDPLLWTVACDLAVNEHLSAQERFADAVTVEAIGREIGRVLPRAQSAETYYEVLRSLPEAVCLADGGDEVRVILPGGNELRAPKDPRGAPSADEAAQVRSLAAELADQGSEEGELSAPLGTQLAEVHGAGRVNWRNVLKRFLTARGTTRPSKTYKRESKRFAEAPGTKRSRGLVALLALDESGSISEPQRAAFLREVAAIRKITGATILATRFDTSCTPPQPLAEFLHQTGRSKGGGTDFRPVFALAEDHRIPLLIVFTDGDGPAPEATDQRVLWVLTKDGRAPAPYGHAVTFEE